jgi:hypothetical protein
MDLLENTRIILCTDYIAKDLRNVIEARSIIVDGAGLVSVDKNGIAFSLLRHNNGYLFVNALNETNRITIGKVVLREKEHLVALRAYQRGLVMHQLKYLDEIKPMDEISELSSTDSSSHQQQ